MADGRKYILDQATAARKLQRMALEIAEQNAGEKELILAGIADNGVMLAHLLAELISSSAGIPSRLITITLDKRKPADIVLSESPDFNDKVIILVDDVANSGKTMLYALRPFLQQHPRKIQTAVLVGRSHSSFPVHTDYVGLSVATTLQEHIFVEVDGTTVTGAYLQ
ncbi:MAG TPA: phosphoribosyltransferase family protein [Chitinophagaceae bacterium]|nr:phosphoribosyltransferase family protein [Chitinophagaceae bacterium]